MPGTASETGNLTSPHGRDALCVWTPDGGALFVAGADGDVRLQLRKGRVIWHEHDALTPVLSLAASPNGQHVSVLHAAEVLIRSSANGRVSLRHQTQGNATFACWSPDSARLALGRPGDVRILNVRTGESLFLDVRQADVCTCGAWLHDGQLALGFEAGHVHLWNVEGNQRESDFLASRSPIGAVCPLRGTWPLAVVSGSVVEIWTAGNPPRRRDRLGHDEPVVRIDVHSPRGLVVTTTATNQMMLWCLGDGEPESCHLLDGGNGAVFSRDGELAVLGTDGGIRFYDTSPLRSAPAVDASLPEASPMSLDGYAAKQAATVGRQAVERRARSVVAVPSNWVPSLPENDGHGLGLTKVSGRSSSHLPGLALSPDASRMFVSYGDRTLGCWDLRSGAELWTYDQNVGDLVAVSPDGQRLAASQVGHDVHIHETTTGRQLQVCQGHTRAPHTCIWSPDSHRVASCSDDHTVRIWDAVSGECLHVCSGHKARIQALAWSPAGSMIASGDDNGAIRLWSPDTGYEHAVWQPHSVLTSGLSWSSDSQALVATYSDGRTLLLDARDGSVLRVLSETIGGGCGACQPAWSPDGRYLACAFRNRCRQIRLWDTRTWQELPTFEFPELASWTLAWSPNGAFLASSHYGNVFRFWDVRHLHVRTPDTVPSRRSTGPLSAELRSLPDACVRLHGLGIDAPLSLIRDLLAVIGGRAVDSPLRQLAPQLKPVAERRWPDAARLGVAAVILHDVPLPGWQTPPDASGDDLAEALTEALHGNPVEPDPAAAPLALLLKSCERLDPRLLDLIELIGPLTLAADPGLALRLLPRIENMPPLADRQRALLGVRSRVQGRAGCATGVAAGADRLIAGGVEMGSFGAQRRHLLPTQLALPKIMLHARHVRGELLFRPREAAEPPRQRPLVILLDVSPPVFGPVEATTRLAAHTAARTLLDAGLSAMLVTPTDAGPPMVPIERPTDLAEIWTRRSFTPADAPRLLALAHALRATLPHEPGIPPLVLLLTHTWFGADDDLPPISHLRGLFIQHPDHPNQPALASHCERHLCLLPGDLTSLSQQLAEVIL